MLRTVLSPSRVPARDMGRWLVSHVDLGALAALRLSHAAATRALRLVAVLVRTGPGKLKPQAPKTPLIVSLRVCAAQASKVL